MLGVYLPATATLLTFLIASFSCSFAHGGPTLEDELFEDVSHGAETIRSLVSDEFQGREAVFQATAPLSTHRIQQLQTTEQKAGVDENDPHVKDDLLRVSSESLVCRTTNEQQHAELDKLIGTKQLYWALEAVSGVYVLLIAALFVISFKYRNHPAVAPRSPLFVTISAFSGLLVLVAMGIGRNFFSLTSFYSFMDVYDWVQNVGIPVFLIPQFLRAFRLKALHNTHVEKLRAAQQWPVDSVSSSRDKQHELESALKRDRQSNSELRYAPHFVCVLLLLFSYAAVWQWAVTSCRILHNGDTVLTIILNTTLILGYIATCFFINSVDEAFGVKQELCTIGVISILFLAAQGGVIYHTRTQHANDSWAFAFPITVSYHYAVSSWVLAVGLCTLWMTVRAVRPPPSSHKSEPFSDFFSNPINRNYFEQYLSLEFSSEYVLFWMDIESFRSRFSATHIQGNADKAEEAKMRVVARNIYNKYIREGSIIDLSLDRQLELEMDHRLASNITAYLFDAAQDAIYVRMSQMYNRFLVHPLGRTCLAHLRGELDADQKDMWATKESDVF